MSQAIAVTGGTVNVGGNDPEHQVYSLRALLETEVAEHFGFHIPEEDAFSGFASGGLAAGCPAWAPSGVLGQLLLVEHRRLGSGAVQPIWASTANLNVVCLQEYTTQAMKEDIAQLECGRWSPGWPKTTKFPQETNAQRGLQMTIPADQGQLWTLPLWKAPKTALEQIESDLRGLQVPFELDKGVVSLLDRATLEAARIVLGILSARISARLPVSKVTIKPLVDSDAGLWSEVVFKIRVDLNSSDANREWDSVIDAISSQANELADEEVAASLIERIGIHFAWIAGNGV